MKQRIKWIDVVRCFGIFLIYLGHFGPVAGRAYEFVFSHHVPLFFLISGCAEAISRGKKITVTVKKVFKDILLPWFFFAILSLGLYAVTRRFSVEEILMQLKEIAHGTIRNHYVASSLWFLTCIAVVRILFSFIKKVRSKPLIILICLALFYFAECVIEPQPIVKPTLPYNFDSALYYIIFYAIGYVIFPFINKALNAKTIVGKFLLATSFGLSATYAGYLFKGKDLLTFLSNIQFLSIYSPIIKVLVTVWMYCVIAKIFQNVSLFSQIGQDTLYLCGNEYIIKQILSGVLAFCGLPLKFTHPFIVYIYCCFLLLFGIKFIAPIQKKLLSYIFKVPKHIPWNKYLNFVRVICERKGIPIE